MKRMLFCIGLAVSLGFFSSCAQHDTKSPDTSGGESYNSPGVGVDTSGVKTQNTGNNANMHNDGTINNQQTNTGDTAEQR